MARDTIFPNCSGGKVSEDLLLFFGYFKLGPRGKPIEQSIGDMSLDQRSTMSAGSYAQNPNQTVVRILYSPSTSLFPLIAMS